jgi:hypothetical protein
MLILKSYSSLGGIESSPFLCNDAREICIIWERSVTLAEYRGSEAGSRGEDVRLCVTGWAAFHSSLVSRGKKIAS